MPLRLRVKELRFIKGRDLVPNEENWREHPDRQRSALRAALEELGIAGVLLAFEERGKVVLFDGHLRQEDYADETWPVAITDLTRDEARAAMLSHDSIAALAEMNAARVLALAEKAQTQQPALAALWDHLREQAEKKLVDEAPPTDGADAADFAEFPDGGDESDSYVAFRFGDFGGRVSRAVYDGFVAAYRAKQQESGDVVLDDVLRGWLGV